MVNKSEHIEIPEVGCPRFANVKRQLEAEDAQRREYLTGCLTGQCAESALIVFSMGLHYLTIRYCRCPADGAFTAIPRRRNRSR